MYVATELAEHEYMAGALRARGTDSTLSNPSGIRTSGKKKNTEELVKWGLWQLSRGGS